MSETGNRNSRIIWQSLINLPFPLTVLTASRIEHFENSESINGRPVRKNLGYAIKEAFLIMAALTTDVWTGYEAFINVSSDKSVLLFRLTLMCIAAGLPT